LDFKVGFKVPSNSTPAVHRINNQQSTINNQTIKRSNDQTIEAIEAIEAIQTRPNDPNPTKRSNSFFRSVALATVYD
jgi:hypothetical protein